MKNFDIKKNLHFNMWHYFGYTIQNNISFPLWRDIKLYVWDLLRYNLKENLEYRIDEVITNDMKDLI